jgi:HAD superfamily hydrolase (TIGR01509 family)
MAASARQAVIFDFDGVLVNSEIIALAELRGCLSEFGIVRSWSEMVSGFLGVSFEDIRMFVSRETGSDPGKRLRETWYARLFERFARELKVMPGAIELLDQLDARGVDYCIASGGSYRRLNYALDLTGLAERFADRRFSADAVARGKPAPDLFLFAATQLHTDPDDCLVVEDAIAGVQAAHAAGIRALAFVGGGHLSERRASHGDRLRRAGAMAVIDDLRQVTRFVDAPRDALNA